MTLAVIPPALTLFVENSTGFDSREQLIVRIDEAVIAMEEGDMDVLADILFVEAEPPFQLHFEEGLPIDVASDEICALPVVGQA